MPPLIVTHRHQAVATVFVAVPVVLTCLESTEVFIVLTNHSPTSHTRYTRQMTPGESVVRRTKDIAQNFLRTFVNGWSLAKRNFNRDHPITWIASRHEQRIMERTRAKMGATWALQRQQNQRCIESMLSQNVHFQHQFDPDIQDTETHQEEAVPALPLNVGDHMSVTPSSSTSIEPSTEEKTSITNALVELAGKLEETGKLENFLFANRKLFAYKIEKKSNQTIIFIDDEAGFKSRGATGVSCSLSFSESNPNFNVDLRLKNGGAQDILELINEMTSAKPLI